MERKTVSCRGENPYDLDGDGIDDVTGQPIGYPSYNRWKYDGYKGHDDYGYDSVNYDHYSGDHYDDYGHDYYGSHGYGGAWRMHADDYA